MESIFIIEKHLLLREAMEKIELGNPPCVSDGKESLLYDSKSNSRKKIAILVLLFLGCFLSVIMTLVTMLKGDSKEGDPEWLGGMFLSLLFGLLMIPSYLAARPPYQKIYGDGMTIRMERWDGFRSEPVIENISEATLSVTASSSFAAGMGTYTLLVEFSIADEEYRFATLRHSEKGRDSYIRQFTGEP